MDQLILITITIVTGILSQIIAYRLRIPAIVPLLIFGGLLGQYHIIEPENLGDGLNTIIQIGVAIILFEGGLSLKIQRFKEAPRVIRNLISLGVLITCTLGTFSAYFLVPELKNPTGFKIALLFGALITVSGPTVIIPLLKNVKPIRKVSTVLKWEGILIDPIGALLAVVMLTFIETSGSSGLAIREFLSSLAIGLAIGGVTAVSLSRLLNLRDFIPENTQNLVVLSMVIGIFTLSNWLQHETGIVAVTVAGFVFGILKPSGLREIELFKGQLTTLMVSVLFILLAARLNLSSIINLGLSGILILSVVLFVIRPINVFISSYKSLLNFREKLFISWIAPRGIVAAAVASLFAETLKEVPDYAHQAEYVESLTFLIIIGTVFFQGATARLVGKLLNVIEPDPNGVIIIGANSASRHLAKEIISAGIEVYMIDSNTRQISLAKRDNIQAESANAVSQETMEAFDLSGYGQLLAITPNDKVNILVCQLWSHELGKNKVFRVGGQEKDTDPSEKLGLSGEGKIVFPQNITYDWLQRYLNTSWVISNRKMESIENLNETLNDLKEKTILPLAIIKGKSIRFYEKNMSYSEKDLLIVLEKKNK